MYLPDAVGTVHHRGRTYVVTANEGDARDYDGFAEETRVGSVTLDPAELLLHDAVFASCPPQKT